jgi:phosphoglycolate phosphatase-like HAD superfamily hydrolase
VTLSNKERVVDHLERLRRRDQTMGIGDQASDVQAAGLAGLTTCYFDPEGMKDASADLVIDRYDELLRFLSGNG